MCFELNGIFQQNDFETGNFKIKYHGKFGDVFIWQWTKMDN